MFGTSFVRTDWFCSEALKGLEGISLSTSSSSSISSSVIRCPIFGVVNTPFGSTETPSSEKSCLPYIYNKVSKLSAAASSSSASVAFPSFRSASACSVSVLNISSFIASTESVSVRYSIRFPCLAIPSSFRLFGSDSSFVTTSDT